MAGIGPLNDSVGVRSITAGNHPANWEGICIRKLLALATLVSQVPGIRGTEFVVPDHTTSIWTMESLLLGFLILLVLVWFGIWGLCYLWGKKQAQKIQMKPKGFNQKGFNQNSLEEGVSCAEELHDRADRARMASVPILYRGLVTTKG